MKSKQPTVTVTIPLEAVEGARENKYQSMTIIIIQALLEKAKRMEQSA